MIRDPMLEQGRSVRSPHPEVEETIETCDKLTAVTSQVPLHHCVGVHKENWE